MSQFINHNQMKILFLAIIGFIVCSILAYIVIVELIQYLKDVFFYALIIRKSHFQYKSTTIVWSEGIWTSNKKDFIPISELQKDATLVVKKIFNRFYVINNA